MKISRNFTLVLFLGAIAAIFFGLVLMRDHKKVNYVSIANQPFFLFGLRQMAGRQGQIQQPYPFNRSFTAAELALALQQGEKIRHLKALPTPHMYIISVKEPTGVEAVMPKDLVSKLTIRVPFTARYRVDKYLKHSHVNDTNYFKPRPKEEYQAYKGFCALEGSSFTIKEDDIKDNFHHVYTLKDTFSYEREKSEDCDRTDVSKVHKASSQSPKFDLCDYPTFWIAPHLLSLPKPVILKQNGKYIFTYVMNKRFAKDYTVEYVDGAPRLSSIVVRVRYFDDKPWNVDSKVVFSNFTKIDGTWLPKAILITTYYTTCAVPAGITPKTEQEEEKSSHISILGVTNTYITITSIAIGKPSPKYFDWRNYAINGEMARSLDTPTPGGELFVINTSNPDLRAQVNARCNKDIEYAKNPLLHRITFTNPFMAQYEEDGISHNSITSGGYTKLLTFKSNNITTLSFDGKTLLAKSERYANNQLTYSAYSLTDARNTVTLRMYDGFFSLDLYNNQKHQYADHPEITFLPYNFNWNDTELSAPLSTAPATLSLPREDRQYQVVLDQGFPKVLTSSPPSATLSDYRLIDNVWIPGQIAGNTRLVYFKPVMPPASDFNLLSVINRNITEKNVMCSVFDVVGNSPEVNGIHKMTIDDFRPINQGRNIRQVRRRIIDLDGPPILQQIYSGQARLFDNSHDNRSMSTEYYETHKPIFLNRNQIR
jgi:hypothetical protein